MKIFKQLLGITVTLLAINTSAQNIANVDRDMIKTTKKISYVKSESGAKTPFRMKVIEKKEYPLALEEADVNKREQDRVMMPAEVVKIIYLDNDYDKYYDKYIVIRYDESYENKFEITPTAKGIGLKVESNLVEDIGKAGYYLTDANDNDYFYVEEFRTIQ